MLFWHWFCRIEDWDTRLHVAVNCRKCFVGHAGRQFRFPQSIFQNPVSLPAGRMDSSESSCLPRIDMNRSRTLLAIAFLFCMPLSSGIKSAQSDDSTTASTAVSLAGDWQSSKFGTQTLSLRSDGSADLKMHLGVMAAVLYGRDITLQLTWKQEGNLLTQQIVGGSPARSVLKLTQKFGTTYVYRILEMTSAELIVEDTSTGKICSWNSLSSSLKLN